MSITEHEILSALSKRWSPSAAQRLTLEKLAAEVDQSGSQEQFCRDYCDFGSSKLSKILSALNPDSDRCYFDDIKDPTREMEDLQFLVESIPLNRSLAASITSQSVHDLTQFRAVAKAINECGAKTNPERLVKYLAPTGGGKSMLCAWLNQHKDLKARVVEVREAWKRSYFTVLLDIAAGVGTRIDGETRTAAIEDALIRFLSTKKILLALDEAEFFGPQAINGLKLLLNKTRLTVVLCSIPEAHDRWNRYFPMEADQLARRTHAVVELSAIATKDAAKFFDAKTFKDEPAALEYLCAEASRFGHYSLLSRVATRLQGVEKNTLDDVKAAVAATHREMRRTLTATK
jgi:hypothetical protein